MNNVKGDKLFTTNISIEDLQKLILELDKIIKYYPENYLKDLGEEYIVRKIISRFKSDKYIDKNYIEILAKEINEKNNKELIIEKPKFKKWSFAWFINIFTGKNEIIKDTKEFDKAEKVLFNEYIEIGNNISKYFDSIEKIKNSISNETYDSLLNTFFDLGNVNFELKNILEEKILIKKEIEEKIIKDEINNLDNSIDENNIYNSNYEKLDENANLKELTEEFTVENSVETNDKNETSEIIDNKNEILESIDNKDIIKTSNNEKEVGEVKCISDEEDNVDINKTKKELENILISDAFSENIFRMFLNYCEENNLITLEQIKDFDFNKLNNIKGFGVGKKKKLMEKYDEVMSINNFKIEEDTEEIQDKGKEEEKEIEILSYYRTLDISVLNGFNKINDKLIKQLKEYEINTIEDLYKRINGDKNLILNLTPTKIKNINLALEKFKIEIYELFNLLIEDVEKNEDYNILIQRAVYDKTLNTIGEEYGVTRERIRQKEKKLVILISNILKIFIKVIVNEDVRFGSVSHILGLDNITQEREMCLTYVLKNSDISGVEYYQELNKFLINFSLEELKNELKDMLDNFSEIIDIDNELNEYLSINNRFSFLSTEDMFIIFKLLGYDRINNYLFKNGVTKIKIYNFIVKEFFKDGIVFSKKEDLNRFKEILKDKFKIQEDSERNIKTKIERYCVLIGRGSYIHPDLIKVDEEILEDIKEYIDNNVQETLYTSQIFSEFEERLIHSGITNRYYLHGILGYYFKGEYKFTKDTITRGNILHSRNYIFNKYVKEKGGVVTKEDLEKDLKGWTPIMFTIAIEECRHILKWDNGGVIHASFIKATLEDVNRIKEELDNLFNNEVEYITDQDVFERFELKFKEFLSNNLIDNKFKMFSVLEYLLGRTYYFRRPYILKDKPKEAVSAVYLMKKLFIKKQIITMDEIKNYCYDIKLNDTTRMCSINKLLKETIEIEKDTYILKENFEIETGDLNKIKNILVNKIEEKGYLALKNIKDYSQFPKINFEWNVYLLKDICEKYIPEIKLLKRQFNDKRYIAPVIVKEDSNMNELLDLIYDILINQFKDKSYIEINVLEKYLRDNNIIYDSIPFELYNCEKINIEDNKIIF